MPLGLLVRGPRTPGNADAVVAHIAADASPAPAYLDKYFAAGIRNAVFRGGSCTGRRVRLSTRAQLLKDAFQRRHVTHGDFQPFTAYHKTFSANIAEAILTSGFMRAGQALYGQGAYFFTSAPQAEGYQTGQAPAGSGESIVMEVTIFSAVSNDYVGLQANLGGDDLIFRHQAVMVAKNPLVIFPKAVFHPGEMRMHHDYPQIEWLGRTVL